MSRNKDKEEKPYTNISKNKSSMFQISVKHQMQTSSLLGESQTFLSRRLSKENGC